MVRQVDSDRLGRAGQEIRIAAGATRRLTLMNDKDYVLLGRIGAYKMHSLYDARETT